MGESGSKKKIDISTVRVTVTDRQPVPVTLWLTFTGPADYTVAWHGIATRWTGCLSSMGRKGMRRVREEVRIQMRDNVLVATNKHGGRDNRHYLVACSSLSLTPPAVMLPGSPGDGGHPATGSMSSCR